MFRFFKKAIFFLEDRLGKENFWTMIIDKSFDLALNILKKNTVRRPIVKVIKDVDHLRDRLDWGITTNRIPELWKKTLGENIKVLVLDTGSPIKHKDLKHAVVKHADFTGSGYYDKDGHSTHVSGIIGARQNNIGIIGVAPMCNLYIGKVLKDDGSGSYSWIVQGIQWGIKEKVDIINMSLGGPAHYPPLRRAIKEAINKGIIVICAAGNEGEYGDNTIGYPGKYEEVITIGAINENLKRSLFSSTGPEIDFVAPGENIYSTYKNNRYAQLSGTSMATPFCTGLVALMISKHRLHGGKTPCSNQQEVFEHLKKITIGRNEDRHNSRTGWGILDAKKLIELYNENHDKKNRKKSKR